MRILEYCIVVKEQVFIVHPLAFMYAFRYTLLFGCRFNAACFRALCHAAQVPLAPHVGPQPSGTIGKAPVQGRLLSVEKPHYAAGGLHTEGDHDSLANWRLDHPPSVNSTHHLIFETVGSLLQQWPNTRMRNGHNIVPGTVPTGTLLYHGTWHPELPPGPDWTAFDPEHSTLFCGSWVVDGRCWHLTLTTTRPLKVVYFDGNSAAKLPFGGLDSQDILTWGDVRPDLSIDDLGRIASLCDWGREYNVDGFVRMEMSFEIMLCNFTSGVRVVSFSNIVDPVIPHGASSKYSPTFEAMYTGSWHNRYPGETRIQLDLSGLVSFYDTELVPSLVPVRFGKERWDHRLLNISTDDVVRVRARLTEVLSGPAGRSSSIHWPALIRVVIDRYSDRLELVQYLLNSTNTDSHDPGSVIDFAIKVQVQLRHMLMPYILVDVTPRSIGTGVNEPGSDALDWVLPVYKLCATTHTKTTREICRVLTKMWGLGVLAGCGPIHGHRESATHAGSPRHGWTGIGIPSRWCNQWKVWAKCRSACGTATTRRFRIPGLEGGPVPPCLCRIRPPTLLPTVTLPAKIVCMSSRVWRV
ncbi:hypothetical protein F5J12DRAFT_922472 [Pisolithus orientalis]|uniref:uncharacterized protein n=1 Tax=Pisolithus orientalis TaxID=936130 RepID=UPI00222522EF|nr:uncharacterized protein F5J12DRAFT_922472 [Pisolithus orientalis]KAI5995278.1 hypothetical protein F5J12DRAFT_922472 [Pisolithus orientalis]